MTEVEKLHKNGISSFQAGYVNEAIDLLRQAIETGEAGPEVFANLGVFQRQNGDYETACLNLELAVGRAPSNADFFYNLALVYNDLGKVDLAKKNYEMAISVRPGMASALNNLGNIEKNRKNYDDAVNNYEQAIKVDKGYVPAYKNLAGAFEAAGSVKAAQENYASAIRLRPESGTRIREALVLPIIPESTDHILECRVGLTKKLDRLLADDLSLVDPLQEVGATNFLLAYHGLNDREIQEKISQIYLKSCPSLAFVAPHTQNWMAGLEGGVPRVGFVSSFFHEHTISKLNKGLINGLPKARFDVSIFSFSKVVDGWSKGFEEGAPKFVSLPKNLSEARQRIAEAELDILYFTDIGMEPLTYFLGFSRLAPIQCVGYGHPVTTGLPNMDYFISGSLIEPEKANDAYSEKLLTLDGVPSCVARTSEFTMVSESNQETGRHILCPQSLFKYHPDFDKILGGILRTLPDAEIQIIDGSHPAWSKLLQKRLLNSLSDVSDRIKILPRLSSNSFNELISTADVILDTPHFSGGFTTYQSLAAGTPVVTLPGKFMRGRVSLGLYRQMQVMECVSENAEDYVEITRRIYLDKTFAKSVREKIQEGQVKVFDNRTAINSHAKFFEKIVAEI